MSEDSLPRVLRRADGLVLRVSGADAVLELPGAPPMNLPGHGRVLGMLWDLLDAPRSTQSLLAALGQSVGCLLGDLVNAGALLAWPLTTVLSEMHQKTVASGIAFAASAACEENRLLRENAPGIGLDLPKPILQADLSEALMSRRTVRELTGASLSLGDLSTLLAFGAGAPRLPALPLIVGGPPGGRTYPSGGGLYPVELIVRPILVDGLESICYRYQVLAHRLVRMAPVLPLPIADRMLTANCIVGASVSFLMWVDFTRPSLGKYGEKAYRLALLEAGHVGQSLLLVAAALGLAGTALCGFDDEGLALEAGLAYPEQPIVYAVALGTPSERSG